MQRERVRQSLYAARGDEHGDALLAEQHTAVSAEALAQPLAVIRRRGDGHPVAGNVLRHGAFFHFRAAERAAKRFLAVFGLGRRFRFRPLAGGVLRRRERVVVGIAAHGAGVLGIAEGIAVPGDHRVGVGRFSAFFRLYGGGVIEDLIPLKIGGAFGDVRPGEKLSGKRFAVGAPVGVILEKRDLAGHGAAGDRADVHGLVVLIEHTDKSAVVRIAAAGGVAVDRGGAAGERRVAAGENAAEKLLAAERRDALIGENERGIRRAVRIRPAAEADEPADTGDAAVVLIDGFALACLREIDAGIKNGDVFEHRFRRNKARERSGEHILRRLHGDVHAAQRKIADRSAAEHGEKARERGVVGLVVPVHRLGAVCAERGDREIVNGMSAAVERAGKGDRLPVHAGHVDVGGENKVAVRRLAQERKLLGGGYFAGRVRRRSGAEREQKHGAKRAGKKAFNVHTMPPVMLSKYSTRVKCFATAAAMRYNEKPVGTGLRSARGRSHLSYGVMQT